MEAFETDVVVLVHVHVGPGLHQLVQHALLQAVDVADEVADELGLRIVVDLVGGADLLDVALVEHGDAVGQGQGLLLVVGDVDGGDAEVLLHLLELVPKLDTELGVQVTEGLVHADDGGVGDQGTGDGYALLLAAGELGHGLLELLVGEVYLPGDLPDPLIDLRLLHLLDLEAEGDIVIDRHGGEQSVALEHDADVAILDGHMGDVPALDEDAPGGGLDEARDGPQRRRLAAAGRSQKCKEFALLHMDVDVMQGGEVAEFHDDVIQFNHMFPLFFPFLIRIWRAARARHIRCYCLISPSSGSACSSRGYPRRARRGRPWHPSSRSPGWS